MVCPSCKNKNFVANEDVRSPLKVLTKFSYDTVNQRQLVCLQCGFVFITDEVYSRPVEIRKNPIQQDLFKNGNQ